MNHPCGCVNGVIDEGPEGLRRCKTHNPESLTPDEIADRTIDYMESIGPALEPWQATTLRAILSFPVGTRFAVSAPSMQRPLPRIGVSRQGFRSDKVVLDEARTGWRKVLRDGVLVWEACPCQSIAATNCYNFDWQCPACGEVHRVVRA